MILLVLIAFSIPAGTANLALRDFGEQSHIQTLYNEDDMASVDTPAVEGDMKPLEAIAVLLKGTRIKWDYVDGRTLTFTLPALPPPEAAKKENAVSAMLIAEECQFGRVAAARAEELMGYSPGRCWCCTKYDAEDSAFCASLPATQACSVYDSPPASIP
jgi:hypothetical protein